MGDGSDKSKALDLSSLLQALAGGAKSVQGLPLNDDFDFEASLPEFHASLQDTQAALLQTLLEYLDFEVDDSSSSIQDPLLWEACADACENLTEQIDAYLTPESSAQAGQLYDTVLTTKSTFSRMVSNMADIEKPQLIYDFWKTDNSRTAVFTPNLPSDGKPNAVAPLDAAPRPGHGLDTLKKSLGHTAQVPGDIVAPSSHFGHPYEPEILALEYPNDQMEPPAMKQPKITEIKTLDATWIDTPSALEELGETLKQARVIAIDLENHSYRSFAGLACLLQISIRNDGMIHNFLVDTIVLKPFMQSALLDALTDPTIVKVLHGADSDVVWLQQHFGLYLVNLFDTRRACDELQFKGSSYAFLLQHYVGIVADKTFQLADWRVRPLPDKLKQYAIQDTAYLLDIYEHLKYDISVSKKTTMEAVLDMSKKVSLIRYGGQPFKPRGYEKLIASKTGGHKSKQRQMTPTQKNVMKALWDWRDVTARKYDESPVYVAPNSALVRLAFCCPTNIGTLQNLFHPMPPIILDEARVIVDLIRGLVEAKAGAVATPPPGVASSSAFFKPKENASLEARRGMMSPVLGTQALYRQAGWMTQEESNANPSSASEDDRGVRTRRTLELNSANANFRASSFAQNSMELGGSSRSSDTRAGVDAEQARESSARVRASFEKDKAVPAILGIKAAATPADTVDDDEEEEERKAPAKMESLGDEFSIPKSMLEIYKISNRNRRLKKTGSPTPERGVTPTSDKEQQELFQAEELLRQRGHLNAGYFDENLSPGKKARRAGRDSEESVPVEPASKEDDLEFMKKIGWVQNQHQADILMDQRYGRKAAAGPEDEGGSGVVGAMPAAGNPNPFFAGAALHGGALAHGRDARHGRAVRAGRGKSGRGSGSSRQQERPRKEEGRSHIYRNKR